MRPESKLVQLALNEETETLIMNPGKENQTTVKLGKKQFNILAGLVKECRNMWTDAQRAAVPMDETGGSR